MKVWVSLIAVAFLQLGVLSHEADATTFDLPLNGEIEITGDISAPTSITFTAVGTSIPPFNNSVEGSWLYSIVLTQSNGSGGFSTPQVCDSNNSCFFLSNFLACGGISCSESNAKGYGYVRNGVPAPILVSDQTNVFTISTNTTDTPFDLEFTVALPDGLGIDELHGPVLDAAAFTPQVVTPISGALPLFGSGLLILVLFGGLKRKRILSTP